MMGYFNRNLGESTILNDNAISSAATVYKNQQFITINKMASVHSAL